MFIIGEISDITSLDYHQLECDVLEVSLCGWVGNVSDKSVELLYYLNGDTKEVSRFQIYCKMPTAAAVMISSQDEAAPHLTYN